MLEPDSPTVESNSTVELDGELVESVREHVGSYEAAEEWIAEAVEAHLGRETDPRPDLSRDEYHRWFTTQAIREKLQGERGAELGPDSGTEQRA